jgi:ribosomal protein S21
MIQVSRKDSKESTENLLRRFNRKVQQSGTLAAVKQNQYFQKPISKRERRRKAIIRQERKALKLKKIKLGQRYNLRLEQDIKSALLAGDASRVSTLRQVKSELLNVKVATGKRESGLSDDEVLPILAKEAKKRQESADLYKQGGNQERAAAELAEKTIIQNYLPAQLSEGEIIKLVEKTIAETGASGPQAMGSVIGQVKKLAGPTADGATIARLVKEKLSV